MNALLLEAAVIFGVSGSIPSSDALLETCDTDEVRSSRIVAGLHIRADRGLAATGGR